MCLVACEHECIYALQKQVMVIGIAPYVLFQPTFTFFHMVIFEGIVPQASVSKNGKCLKKTAFSKINTKLIAR